MRTASEHFTTRCIVDFLHLYDHLSVARVIKGDVEVVVVQIDGIDKGFYQPLLAITVCHVHCGHVMQEKQNRKSEAQRLRENEKLCFSALMEYIKLLQEWKVLYAPRSPEDTPHDRFVQACHHLSYVEYLVDLLIMGDFYERTGVIDMLMTDDKLQKLQKHLKKARKEEKHIGEQEL